MKLNRIDYGSDLNSRQQEAYNFQKIAAVLADYGYCAIRLSDDWGGADFIAQHISGSFFKVQLKGRLTLSKAYENKDLWVCFRDGNDCYIYPHDELLRHLRPQIEATDSWAKGAYNWPYLNPGLKTLLTDYRIE